MIDKVLLEGRSQKSVSLDYCLPSGGMLPNQIAQYKKMGILLLRKQEGDRLKLVVNASILHTKEKLARKQITLFNGNLKHPN